MAAVHHRFFTLGMVWLVAAASLAEPDSWWAARFYDDRKRERAAHPERNRGPARATAAAAVASILVTIVVLGLFATYPSPILGVDGKSLEYSVAGPSTSGSASACHKESGRVWICPHWRNEGSSFGNYRVTVDGLGCWTAVPAGASGESTRKKLFGCITIRDHIRPFDRLPGSGSGSD
jgi:hypothetical protein